MRGGTNQSGPRERRSRMAAKREGGGDDQAEPKARRAEVSAGMKLGEPIDHGVRVCLTGRSERRGSPPNHRYAARDPANMRVLNAIFSTMRDRQNGKHRPEERRAPRPAGDQQQPAVDRRVPERVHGQAVEQHQRHPEQRQPRPQRRRSRRSPAGRRCSAARMTSCVATTIAKASSRQHHERDARLREHRREVRDRQRLPEQDAAIAPLAVERVEAVERRRRGTRST